MEVWDLYNESREKLGIDHIRGEELPEGCYHLVVHVWIRGRNGQYLISQRSADRRRCPLMWECVGGSALKGEDSITAALREVFEEVGITLTPENGKLLCSRVRKTVNGVKFNDILDIWRFDCDDDADLSRATTNEVAQTKWMNETEIEEMLKNGKMVRNLSYFSQVLCK